MLSAPENRSAQLGILGESRYPDIQHLLDAAFFATSFSKCWKQRDDRFRQPKSSSGFAAFHLSDHPEGDECLSPIMASENIVKPIHS